jgi:hypothetical protein
LFGSGHSRASERGCHIDGLAEDTFNIVPVQACPDQHLDPLFNIRTCDLVCDGGADAITYVISVHDAFSVVLDPVQSHQRIAATSAVVDAVRGNGQVTTGLERP